MRALSVQALDELAATLLSHDRLDRQACRRLAIRITGSFQDPEWAGIMHDELCEIINAHDEDPDHAFERFDFLRPAIESQMKTNQ